MNPIFGWIAYGIAILAGIIWIAALSSHLAIARNFGQPGNTDRTHRDNNIGAALLLTLIAIALVVPGLVFR